MLSGERKQENIVDKKLTVVGVEVDSESKISESERIEEQDDIREYEEDGRTKSESSEYEDAEMEEFTEEHEVEDRNESSTDERDEEHITEDEDVDIIQAQPREMKTRGRPKGTTKGVMEMRKNLRYEEEERKREQGNVKRSERIKNQQSAMIIIDKNIPKI